MAIKLTFLAFSILLCALIGCVSEQALTDTSQATPDIINNDDGAVRGGTLVFPIPQDPPTLNPYISQTGVEALIAQNMWEGLAAVGPDGSFYPVLAESIPTTENGGVSKDGSVVTWKLKKNIFWSDGEKFTSEDVRFTWEAVSHAESGATWAPGVDSIDSVEILDEYTVVITYKQYYPDYLGQFSGTSTAGQGIFPKHACGEPSQMSRWECNRTPVVTGPFVLDEWKTGQYIRLIPNPYFREDEKPYLDEILFSIVPDSQVHRQLMIQGDADVWWEFDQQYIDEFSTSNDLQIYPGSEQWLLRLFLNLSEKASGDPKAPHPILADKRVRKAIEFAIDREAINNGVFSSLATPMNHELYHGTFTCPGSPITYDPGMSRTLLDEAGWIDTDQNGIRECRGCVNSEEGAEMRLTYSIESGGQPYALTQQLIVDMLLDVGIDVEPRLEEGSVLNDQSLAGDFDLLMWSDGYESAYDPGYFLELYYASKSIPPTSWNITRFTSQEVDGLLEQAKLALEPEDRQRIYCQIDKILSEESPVVYLLVLPFPSVFSNRVQDWEANPNAILTWDAMNWRLVD